MYWIMCYVIVYFLHFKNCKKVDLRLLIHCGRALQPLSQMLPQQVINDQFNRPWKDGKLSQLKQSGG